jgi:hypothetical protein
MTGHVFHPGHHELHGITVVVRTTGSRILVGRFDKQDENGVHLIGVSIHDASASDPAQADFLSRTVKYGVRVDQPHLVIPQSQVREITPLGTISM